MLQTGLVKGHTGETRPCVFSSRRTSSAKDGRNAWRRRAYTGRITGRITGLRALAGLYGRVNDRSAPLSLGGALGSSSSSNSSTSSSSSEISRRERRSFVLLSLCSVCVLHAHDAPFLLFRKTPERDTSLSREREIDLCLENSLLQRHGL